MESTPNRFKSFVPPLIAGLVLVALGACGLAYSLISAVPIPSEQVPPFELEGLPPDIQTVSSPTPIESAEEENFRKVRRLTQVPEPPPPEPPKVSIVSPASGSTYLRGQSITYAANVIARSAAIRKVEFFAGITSPIGFSGANNSRDIELPAGEFIKIGEASRVPYSFANAELTTGHYSIFAIVTDARGVRQLSAPNVIFMENFAPSDYSLIKGWGDSRDRRKYQDFGIALYEHTVLPGEVWRYDSFTDPPDKPCLEFSLKESRLPDRRVIAQAVLDEDQKAGPWVYAWSVAGAKITEGQGTDRIVIAELNGSNAMATVVIRSVGGCAVTRSISIPAEVYLGISTRVDYDSELAERIKGFTEQLRQHPNDRGEVLVYGDASRCRSEIEWIIKRLDEHISKEGIATSRITIVPVGYEESRHISFFRIPPGADGPPVDSGSVGPFDPNSPACDFVDNPDTVDSSPPRFRYQRCPEIVQATGYRTMLVEGARTINVCPFNPLDPQDESKSLRVNLESKVLSGIYGNVPKASYFTNGGVVTPDSSDSNRSIWDLTAVRYVPGYYTVAADMSDDCGSNALATRSVVITNYCRPCLDASSEHFCAIAGTSAELALEITNSQGDATDSLTYDWHLESESSEIVSGQGTSNISAMKFVDGTHAKIDVNVQGVRRLGRTARFTLNVNPLNDGARLRYRWAVSHGTIVSGQDSKTIEVDLGGARSDKLEIKVDIDRLTELQFSSESYDWSRMQGLSDLDLKYNWKVDKGEIVAGQGTKSIFVAGYLPDGTVVTATVETEGLLDYCAKSIVAKGTVLSTCPEATANLVDSLEGPPSEGASKAKRKKRYVVVEEYYYEGENQPGSDTPVNDPDRPDANGKEYMSVRWPNPVQVGDAITIKAIYNRQTDELELKNEAGDAVFAVKKPIATFGGKDYEVWGRVALQSGSLFENGSACTPQCYAMPKPISSETEQTWTFSLTAKEAGSHSFNLELLIEGRHKYDQTRIDERPAWSADNLKIQVRDDLPTHTQLLISSIILCTGGLGFCVRSLRIRSINIALFGGANVAGDQIKGRKIINEGDRYEVENAAVVGANVEINNSNIEQRFNENAKDKDPN